MSVAVVGLSHHTAPIEVRERLALRASAVPAHLSEWLTRWGGGELVLLSTCNRTEAYISAPDHPDAAASARGFMRAMAAGSTPLGDGCFYEKRDREAVRHLFRVAGGLDSLVVGEAEIQGQVRDAYLMASETVIAGEPATGATLNRLFQSALGVGGRIRSETGIGTGAASVPSAAVDLAKKIFGSLRDRRALVLGAGDMAETTLECLRGEGVRASVVANRTYDRALTLAERWGARAIHFDGIQEALPSVDIVVASTAAPHAVLTMERFRSALPDGASRPLCVLDIALPRDVDPALGGESHVFLYNLDDLKQIVDDTLRRRWDDLPDAEAIVDEGVEEFWRWYSTLEVVPTIRSLRDRAERVRRDEVRRALRRLEHLDPEDRAAIEALTRSLLNKILHSPTVRLRDAVGNGRGTAVIDTVRYLFELENAHLDDAFPDDED